MVKKFMSLPVSGHMVVPPQRAFAAKARPALSGAQAACHVDVYDDPSLVLAIWRELAQVAPASAYQTPGFVLAWLATLGSETEIKPMFVVQRDADGLALALFCFGLKRFGPFRAAVFLGGRDSNFNFGLFRPGFTPDAKALIGLFRAAARAMPKGPDLYLLLNQPLAWNGWSNPLAALPRQQSPSFAYKATPGADAERFFQTRLSKDTRKKMRKKESRLAELGALRHIVAGEDSAMRQQIIDAFFVQKIARFAAQNIEAGFEDPARRRFVELASQPTEAGAEGRLDLHALCCGEQIVATFGGTTHQGHFNAFFNSFDAHPDIAKSSPGDLLLLKLIGMNSAAGVTSFDLGIGEARYKNMVCDETIVLFDSFLPVTLKGRLLAAVFSLGLRIKRALKQNRKAYTIALRLRAALHR